MMGFLLLFIVFMLMLYGAAKTARREQPFIPIVTCPPHQWKHREIKDEKGDTVAWQLRCDVCGPLKMD